MLNRLTVALFGCCLCVVEGFCATGAAQSLTSAGSYFAPYGGGGMYRMRLSDGAIREFELIPGTTNRIRSCGGSWTGILNGDDVEIRSPASYLYRFKSGRLVDYLQKDAFAPNSVAAGTWPELPLIALWPPDVDEKKVMDAFDTWRTSRFLKLGFVNPNRCGAFLALLALFFVGLAVHARRRWWRVTFGLCAAVLFAAVLLTHSRGAVVAFSIGSACYILSPLER